MSEQDDASVNRFLDGLDVEMDEQDEEDASQRSRAAVPAWEYMTWRVGHLGGADADVRIVNGEEFESKERPPFYEALMQAGNEGWELVGFDDNSGALIFKRPRVEG